MIFDLRYPKNVSFEFANMFYTISYTIAEESLKILEWANNNVQRCIKLSTPLVEKRHQDSTVYPNTNLQHVQSLMCKSYIYIYIYMPANY